jgi:ABC-type molybdate transport system permease subunit
MLEAVIQTLQIMGWLGIIFAILVITNIVAGTLANIWSGKEPFSGKKMMQGILKALVFYISSVAIGVAFTMLPFINDMITLESGSSLISQEMLDTLSNVGILSIIISAIISQGKKALENILKLASLNVKIDEKETITGEEESAE